MSNSQVDCLRQRYKIMFKSIGLVETGQTETYGKMINFILIPIKKIMETWEPWRMQEKKASVAPASVDLERARLTD